ncbi:MAG: VCBS repeat-containing protein [Bacteroidota bacterium]|nr:VCBS repeat-containing protein [Bacteroidota bacterium]
MFRYSLTYIQCILLFFIFATTACNKNKKAALFETLTDNQTGIHFTNKLMPTDSFNMFHYMYFYNGAGVGAGDFNNDGKIDLFFAANQGDNKLFLNQGNMQFKDVTTDAHVPQDKGWSTGISVVDINNDGLLDIYVCKVGNYETLHGKNQLLICTGIKNGIPQYTDEAAAYGLDFSGFSTQAVFFDYDMDGDLDMFLLNHSVHQNGSFAPRNVFLGTYNALSGDRLFRNDGNNHFTDVTKESKINSSAISYGLGVAVSDINLDGWPDLYVGNDFHENDYLYINQHNGTFAEEGAQRMMHTSQFSMGVDVADANNDGYPEIISMDMLPSDPYILKRSLGEDDYDIFYHKISYGYTYQYTRNNLQYNRRNGMFSEVGLYAGVSATDWSWAPLWMDFNNDGLKDLFISNGIPKRMNDMDYVNFISNEEIQQKLKENKINEKDMALVNKFPEIKIPNKFYLNKGDMQFEDEDDAIENSKPTFSNGAVYADLDNDGDLDVVVNNVDEPVLVYENKSNDKKDKPSVEVHLKGPDKNINAIGAKIIMFANGGIRTYEKNPARGFQSSMELPLHIGLVNTKIDSAFLVWPDNSYQRIQLSANTSSVTFKYVKGLPAFNYASITTHWKNYTIPVTDITSVTGLQYVHHEDPFIEFNREPLIPHMVSTEGPAVAVGDLNHDGLDDIFLGSSKSFHSAIFLQQPNGKFSQVPQPLMAIDSMCEDVDAVFTDVNHDGNPDLVIASGGNEYYGMDEKLKPRVYLNDGKAHFKKLENAFGNIFITQSCVTPCDFNGDGNIDLFIGGRVVPWEYGKTPRSYLLQNDGTGKFTDVTERYAKDLANIGMVTQALWIDLDKDGDQDLVVACEWGGIIAFINNKGSFSKKELTDKKGWWNCIIPVDMNNDGNIDFIAGNLGLNSRLQASKSQPVKLYYNDFDGNGKKEQILTYYLNGKEIPFANKDELQKQLPALKMKFLYAEDFAKATLEEIFTKDKLQSSTVLTADYFSNALLVNNGNLNFTTKALPWEAQLSPLRDAVVVDANGDHRPDIMVMGNYYESNIQMGRYDADFGTLLINNGNGTVSTSVLNGLEIKGQVRHIKPIYINKALAYVLAQNNDTARIIKFVPKN